MVSRQKQCRLTVSVIDDGCEDLRRIMLGIAPLARNEQQSVPSITAPSGMNRRVTGR
jgi:hypothetical protein